MVICAPSGITEVERRAVEEATLSAGAREVHLIEESLAAAIGAGIDIGEPVGRMVVDIGGGTSEVAVISLGGLVVARSLRVGGYDLDDAITNHIRLEHRMAIGSQSAEAIKLAAGSAIPLAEEIETSIRGRDLASGLPREIVLTQRGGPPGDRLAAGRDHDRDPRDAGGDAARAGGRHHHRGRAARRRRLAAARVRAARRPRRPECRCGSPTTRSPASPPAPACRWRNSTRSRAGAATARAEARVSTLRRTGTGGREAEGTRLLSEYGVYSSIAGSNPALSVAERPANPRFPGRVLRGVPRRDGGRGSDTETWRRAAWPAHQRRRPVACLRRSRSYPSSACSSSASRAELSVHVVESLVTAVSGRCPVSR